jgi:hypothetical protein
VALNSKFKRKTECISRGEGNKLPEGVCPGNTLGTCHAEGYTDKSVVSEGIILKMKSCKLMQKGVIKQCV